MKLNLIQIFAVAVALAIPAAQASGQNTAPGASPTAKPSPQAGSADSTKTDSNGKNPKKPTAAAPKTGATGQSSGIKVVVPGKSGSQPTPAASQNTAAKPGAPSAPGSSPSAAKKTTGTTPATGSKKTVSGQAATHPAGGQNKPPVPAVSVKPASRQIPVKKSATASPARKTTGTGNPFVRQAAQPKIVQKKPARADLVSAAKTTSKISSAGRRDPFVNPIRNVAVGGAPGPISCATGKRCLAVAELTVQGTAKDADGKMMAIIARGANHPAYFLRENDQIFNGNVVKITCDSVVFREYATDVNGRQNAHEVVKSVFPSTESHKCRSSQ